MNFNKLILMVLFVMVCYTKVIGQDSSYNAQLIDSSSFDTYISSSIKKTRNIFGFIPNGNTKRINGLSIGLCLNSYDSIEINGLNIEILGGWVGSPSFIAEKTKYSDTAKTKREYYKKYIQKINGITLATIEGVNNAQVNGITISPFDNLANEVNGVGLAILANGSQFFNGLELAVFANVASRGRGIQIAAINTCYDFRGIQIGLWNKNDKRSLPFINWQFRP